MSRRTHLEPHLTAAELEARYRQARDPVERSHFQILWRLAAGQTQVQVSDLTGYSRRWISILVARYNADGPAALADQRHHNPGGRLRLNPDQQERLRQALAGPAPDGGLWTGPKVAAWIAAETGQPTWPQLGWRYLVRLGYRLKRPRPRHAQADAEAQAAFPKP